MAALLLLLPSSVPLLLLLLPLLLLHPLLLCCCCCPYCPPFFLLLLLVPCVFSFSSNKRPAFKRTGPSGVGSQSALDTNQANDDDDVKCFILGKPLK
jgi:hypothetical protein